MLIYFIYLYFAKQKHKRIVKKIQNKEIKNRLADGGVESTRLGELREAEPAKARQKLKENG